MLVMGGIVGAGLFVTPYIVAERVPSPIFILAAWAAGGLIALLGAFIYAELADRIPSTGGEYAYLRDCYHPIVGFLFGWVTLLVVMTGGMAAVAVTFARYFLVLTGLPLSANAIVVLTLILLTVVNCLGVRLGSRLQSLLMVLKIAMILALIAAGFFLIHHPFPITHPVFPPAIHGTSLLTAFGAAMIPVLFAYGGWQTTNFIAGEIRNPRRNLTRALMIGVLGVILLYLATNLVCVRALSAPGLAATTVPASTVMHLALGPIGARLIAAGIAVSTLGFLSQAILTGPRVYFAMARDGLFFASVASVTRRTHVPAVAIVLQSVWTIVIALSGSYEQILNYVVCTNFRFFGVSASCLFVLRHRDPRHPESRPTRTDASLNPSDASLNPSASPATPGFRTPGHPYTTLLFILACWSVVFATVRAFPANSLIGFAILLLGVPVYFLWNHHKQRTHTA
jgi:APA family basic amino acid/polyamine antiporter